MEVRSLDVDGVQKQCSAADGCWHALLAFIMHGTPLLAEILPSTQAASRLQDAA